MDIKSTLFQLSVDLKIQIDNISILKLNDFSNLEKVFKIINTSHKILYIKKGKHNEQFFTLMSEQIFKKYGKKRSNHIFFYKGDFIYRAEKVLRVFKGLTYDTLFNEINKGLFGIDPFSCYICKNPEVNYNITCNTCKDCRLCKECIQLVSKCPKCNGSLFGVMFD